MKHFDAPVRLGSGPGVLRHLAIVVLVAMTTLASAQQGDAGAAQDCSKLRFREDYLDMNDPKNAWFLKDNDTYHCDHNVRALTGNARWNRPDALMSDIHWTLTRFPNHYPCMLAVVRYHAKKGYPFHANERQYPNAECYVKGAIEIWPNDAKLWFMLGYFYQLTSRPESSVEAYEKTLELNPAYYDARYNLGLLYTELKQYDKALEHAKAVYAAGYPLPGLRNKLKRAGAWNAEP